MRHPSPIRLCIVEGHHLVRAGLTTLLDMNSEFVVVGIASNREEALKVGSEHSPNVFLVDVGPGPDVAPACLQELLASSPGSHAILVTATTDSELLHRSIDAGANGLVFKWDSPKLLIDAIQRVDAGEISLSRSMFASVLARRGRIGARAADPEQSKIASLTPREREVAVLIATGTDRKQTAEKLSVSASAIRNHLTSIFAKLQVSSQYELVFYAQRHGLDKHLRP
jgi:DNA-binding NarL/FixJ family response regulator